MVSSGEKCYGLIHQSGQIWGKSVKQNKAKEDLVVEFEVDEVRDGKVKGKVTDNMTHPTVTDGHKVTYDKDSEAWGLHLEDFKDKLSNG